MTPKQRILAAMTGQPVDQMPVAAMYVYLYHQDHFAELTGLPAWQRERWRYLPVDEHMQVFRTILDAVPFDIVQPHRAAT